MRSRGNANYWHKITQGFPPECLNCPAATSAIQISNQAPRPCSFLPEASRQPPLVKKPRPVSGHLDDYIFVVSTRLQDFTREYLGPIADQSWGASKDVNILCGIELVCDRFKRQHTF